MGSHIRKKQHESQNRSHNYPWGRVLTIARSGQSKVVVANILGVTIEEGDQCWYLDRLIHAPHENELGEYQVSGAISSKLHKPLPLTQET